MCRFAPDRTPLQRMLVAAALHSALPAPLYPPATRSSSREESSDRDQSYAGAAHCLLAFAVALCHVCLAARMCKAVLIMGRAPAQLTCLASMSTRKLSCKTEHVQADARILCQGAIISSQHCSLQASRGWASCRGTLLDSSRTSSRAWQSWRRASGTRGVLAAAPLLPTWRLLARRLLSCPRCAMSACSESHECSTTQRQWRRQECSKRGGSSMWWDES